MANRNKRKNRTKSPSAKTTAPKQTSVPNNNSTNATPNTKPKTETNPALKSKSNMPTPKTAKGKTPKDVFKSVHKATTGTTNVYSNIPPNTVFFAGGLLVIAASWPRIKKIFQYAWGGNAYADASKNPSDFWTNLKTVLVQILFIFMLTMSARIFPPLGRMWLITIIGLWILFIMRNPQVFKLLQVAGQG